MSEPRAGLATCPEHQLLLDVPCGRCGDYECTRCITTLEGTGYCRRCVADGRARDYLDDYRDRLWGKRDGWAWLIGLGAIANIFVILATIGTRTYAAAAGGPGLAWWEDVLNVGLQVFQVAVGVSFFMGIRKARSLLVLSLVLEAAYTVLALLVGSGPAAIGAPGATPAMMSAVLGALVGGFLLQLLLLILILNSPRNKLFFKIEISRKQLEKLYLQRSNPPASYALLLGIPGLIPISLPLAIWGLMKVDRARVPPVGGRGYAIWAIVFSLLWCGFWALLLLGMA